MAFLVCCIGLCFFGLLMAMVSTQKVMRGNMMTSDQFQNPLKSSPRFCKASYCSDKGAYCDSSCCLCTCNYGESYYQSTCQEDLRIAKGCSYTIGKQFDPTLIPVTFSQLRSGILLFHCSNVIQYDICSAESTQCKLINAQSYYDSSGWKPLWEDDKEQDISFETSTPSDKLKWIGRECRAKKYEGLVLRLGVECTVKGQRRRSCVILKVSGSYQIGSNPNLRVNCPPTTTKEPTTTQITTTVTTTQATTTTTTTTTQSTTQPSTSTRATSTEPNTSTEKASTTQIVSKVLEVTAATTTKRDSVKQHTISTNTTDKLTSLSPLINNTSQNTTGLGKRQEMKPSFSTFELALILVCFGLLVLLIILIIILVGVYRKRRRERKKSTEDGKAGKPRSQKSHSTCELINPKLMYEDYVNGRLSIENGVLPFDNGGRRAFHVIPLTSSTIKEVDTIDKRQEGSSPTEGSDNVLYDTPADNDSGRGTARQLYAVVHKPKKSVVSETDEGYTSVDERSPKNFEQKSEKITKDVYDVPGSIIAAGTPPSKKKIVPKARHLYDVYERQYDQPFADNVYDDPIVSPEYDQPITHQRYDTPESAQHYDEPEAVDAKRRKRVRSAKHTTGAASIQI